MTSIRRIMITKDPKKLLNNNISYYLYLLLLCSFVIDFSGAFHIKYPVAFICAVYSIFFSETINRQTYYLDFWLFFIIPSILFLCSITLHAIDLKNAFSSSSFLLTFLLYPLISSIPSHKLIASYINFSICLSLIVIITWLIILTQSNSAIEAIRSFCTHYRIGFIELKRFGSILIPGVYFNWSMFLILGLCLLNKIDKRFVIILTGIILIGSSAIIACSLLGVFIRILFIEDNKKILNMITLCFIIYVIFLLITFTGNGVAIDFAINKFSANSDSTSIKLLKIKYCLDAIFSSASVFLFGSGIGSSFSYLHNVDINMEISTINMARQYGVIYTLCFTTYILNNIYSLSRADYTGKMLASGLLCTYLSANTNPQLMSPLFALVLMIACSYKSQLTISEAGSVLI